jgi:hypothetical protein
MANPTIVFNVPDQEQFLRAFCEVQVMHTHLEYTLRMTFGSVAGVDYRNAREATDGEGPAIVRKRIKKLARTTLGEGAALVKLQALINRCRRAGEVHQYVERAIGVVFGDGALRRVRFDWCRDLYDTAIKKPPREQAA